MDFSCLVSVRVQERKLLAEKMEQERLAQQEREQEKTLVLVEEELSHLFDSTWSVEPIAPKVAIAYSNIHLNLNGQKKEFRFSLLKDINRQGYYIPRLEEIEEGGGRTLISQWSAEKATELSKDKLADLVSERIWLHLSNK